MDVLESLWPDSMGDPKEDVDLFGAWSMGAFGPLAFPGNLKRAAEQAVAFEGAAAAVSAHRAFVRLRQLLINDMETAKRLVELEAKVGKHDRVIKQLTDAAREFIRDQARIKAQIAKRVDPPKKRRLGFRNDD